MIQQVNSRVRISEDWLIEQQRRAEAEADVWRRLREHLDVQPEASAPTPAPVASPPQKLEPLNTTVRTVAFQRKIERLAFAHALVQLGFCLLGAFLASFAVMMSGGGILEEWLAGSTGFALCVALLVLFQRRPLPARLAQASVVAIVVAGGFAMMHTWPV